MMTGSKVHTGLNTISPAALSAYARTEGWSNVEAFGDHADVYIGDGLPEIIVPRTRSLGDYAHVVARLVEIFASVAAREEHELYNDLITADRDVIRVQVDGGNDTVDIERGAKLIAGARDMLLAVADSLQAPQPLDYMRSHQGASKYVSQVRLAQTEPGSFGITLLSPVIAPPLHDESLLPDPQGAGVPFTRQVTCRMCEALAATKQAIERAISGDLQAFAAAVASSTSANLCDALIQMIEPFPALVVKVTWARTRPVTPSQRLIRFTQDDVPILGEAARVFRTRELQPDVLLLCSVQRLQSNACQEGTVTLRTFIEDKIQSVKTVLNQQDYHQAIDAHKEKMPVIMQGNLERYGQWWRLQNPRIVTVITDEDAEEQEDSLTSP